MNQNLSPKLVLQEFVTSPKSSSIKQEQNNINITHTNITQNETEIYLLHNELHETSNQRVLEIDNYLQFRNNLTTNTMISSILEARTQNIRISSPGNSKETKDTNPFLKE